MPFITKFKNSWQNVWNVYISYTIFDLSKTNTMNKQKQYNREAVIILVLAFLATAVLQNI